MLQHQCYEVLNKTTEELEQISKTFAEYVKSVENEVKT